MPDADTIMWQSSKGFFHWLKNTWLGKLWNYITSCFRPKKQKTEFQSTSIEEKKTSNDDEGSKSHAPWIEQNEVSESSQNREEIRGDVQKGDDDSSQISINHKSSAISRSQSEASLNRTALSVSLANSLGRSLSLNDLSQTSTDSELEWDNSDLNPTSPQPEAQETSSQSKQKLGSDDTEEEKGSEQNNRKRRNASKTGDISGNSNTGNKEGHREQVLKNKQDKDRENEKKGEETLKKSNEKQNNAAKKREEVNKQKSERAKKSNVGNYDFKYDDDNHKSTLSNSTSSLVPQNNQER